MTHKFTSFFNYLFSLLVVLTLSIGNAWGTDYSVIADWRTTGTGALTPTIGATSDVVTFSPISKGNAYTSVDKTSGGKSLTGIYINNNYSSNGGDFIDIRVPAGYTIKSIDSMYVAHSGTFSGKKGAYMTYAASQLIALNAKSTSPGTEIQYDIPNVGTSYTTVFNGGFTPTAPAGKTSDSIRCVRIYKKASSGQSHYIQRIKVTVSTVASGGGGCTNVGIGTQPTSPVAATVGSACSISGLVASGTNPTYQWYSCNSDGSSAVEISAAGAMSFTGYITATLGLTPTSEGTTYYKCVVSGDCGDPVTSNVVAVNATPTYTVTYNDNGKTGGGAAPSDATAYASGAEVTVLGNPNDMTKTNCVFIGWNTKADGTGTIYIEGEKFNMPSENTTLYAMWGVKLSWVVQVNVAETTVTTTSTASSYTTGVAAPSNLALNDLEVTSSSKSTATNKISTTKAKGGYISATFAVQSGYEFTPTHMVLKTTAISEAITVEVNVGSEAQTWAQPKSGSDPDLHVYKFADPEAITGSGTMKIYAYGGSDGTKGYRLGTPIEIYGFVTESAAPSGYAITTSTTNGTIAVTDGSSAISSADENDVVYIAATPDTGYGFTSWDVYKTSDATTKVSLLADDDSDNKTRKFSMPAYAVTVGATFTAINYTVTHNAASNGSYTIKVGSAEAVSTNTTANYGQTVILAATPNTGYTFAGWTVLQGETPVSVTNNAFTMPAGNVTVSASFEEIVCPTEGTVYSLSGWKTSNSSTWVTANNSSEQITGLGTLTGGAAYAVSIEASKVPQKDNDGKDNMAYKLGYNSVALRCALDCPLQEGDLITIVSSDSHSNAFILTKANSRSNAETTSCSSGTNTYTVKSNDKIVGATDLYIWRSSSTLNIMTVSITRPEKFDVTYYKNDGSGTSTLAENVSVVAANEFSRSGYRFIEWNTQADGEGTTKAVGAAVTADMDLYAIWAQEYSVSYANTGAASGAAPTNDNKYIAGETFKVAGVGSMVAATNYSFGGWNDGSNTYAENDNYTVGSANVSFSPVWVLSYNVTYKANGGTKASGAAATDIVANNPSTIAQCQFLPADGKVFTKWNTQADGGGVDYLPGASISTAVELYAQYETVSCDARQSITKAVLTSASAATTSGYNDKEYAGDAKINGLGGGGGTAVADLGEGEVTGYKLAGQKSILFATLAKGSFQAGDQLVIGITKASEGAGQQLEIYAGSDQNNVLKVINLDNISAAGYYRYTLTAADAAAINAAGYKSIGLYRSQGTGGQNPFVYSIELTGCRSWSIYHTLTFKNADGSATIASESLAEGAYASTVAPAAPRIKGKRFLGWSESVDGDVVNLTEYTITEDKILYIVYEDVDCPTSGTIYKFQLKTGLADETLGISTNKDMSEYVNASGDGYLTYTSAANNYAVITNDSLIQMKNTTAYLKVDMDCALAAGDRIRVRCYNNPINVQVGTSYDSSKDLNFARNDFGWQDITASMVGKSDLYITRASNGNANIAYVEIYRRPALTGVTMDNLRLKVGQSGTPILHLLPNEDAYVSSQAWEITASTATGTTINASTGLITAGETPGEMTVQVTLNGDKVASATVAIVRGFEAPVPVTTSTVWDWSSLSVASGDGPTIANPDTVLANYLSGAGWENLAGNNNGRPYRSSTYKAYQGTSLYFKAAVPGKLTINGTYTSSNKKVYVNGIEVGTLTNLRADLSSIVVSAGDVYITSESMRIYSMTFDTNLDPTKTEESLLEGYEREVNPQYYGTICLPKAGVMTGALLFQIAYMDYKEDGVTPYKVYYDQVENGIMQAGMPYIFWAEQSTIGVYYTGTAEESAKNFNGLHGTLVDMVDMSGTGIYMLYNNKVLHSTNPASYLNANRAYIQISEIPGYNNPGYMAPAPKIRRISTSFSGTNVATGLDQISQDPKANSQKILINGQLFIRRGDKLFDATGRLVK